MSKRPAARGVGHSIEIAAPASAVWAVLADLDRWGDWNPLYVEAAGRPVVGMPFATTIALEGMKPHLAFNVENKLSEDADAPQLKVDLHFKSLEDFEPERVARQVKPLRELLDLRTRLSDLRGSLQGNDKLDEVLLSTVQDFATSQNAAVLEDSAQVYAGNPGHLLRYAITSPSPRTFAEHIVVIDEDYYLVTFSAVDAAALDELTFVGDTFGPS